LLPHRDVIVEFETSSFLALSADKCRALRLEEGATIYDHVKLTNGDWLYVYASMQAAESVLDIPKGSRVRAQGVTVYGTTREIQYGEDGAATTTEEQRGVRLTKILAISPPEVKKDS